MAANFFNHIKYFGCITCKILMMAKKYLLSIHRVEIASFDPNENIVVLPT